MLVLVTDQENRPIGGVRLNLAAPDGTTTAIATTGRDGSAGFENLPDGRYSVRAHPAGARRSRTTHVSVRAGLESTVILTLETDDADTVIVKPKSR